MAVVILILAGIKCNIVVAQAGFHFQHAGGAGAEAQGKPDSIPRRIRAQQQTPSRCDACQTWQRFQAS